MTNKFNKGDVVQLISGGPAMTVDAVPGDPISEYNHEARKDYRCEWFKGATAAHGNYGEHLLQKFTPPKK